MWLIFYSVCALTFASSIMASGTIEKQFETSSNNFAADLYQKTIERKSGNVIISPISIQSAVSLAMFGANGETKEQILQGLKYPTGYADSNIALLFEQLTENIRETNGLKIANKIYTMKGFTAKQSFREIASKSFNSDAQDLDFSESAKSAGIINSWVEEQTNNKIKDLVTPDSFDENTRMVLVNAIYFKGKWTHPFDTFDNYRAPFYINHEDSVRVEFMTVDKYDFKYGKILELDATAVELPYRDTNISMLIILPNDRNGLPALERKLQTVDLDEITRNMKLQWVQVDIPKFKIEFSIELNEPLQKMGMTSMFSDAADFSNLLEVNEPWAISEVIHKAFIKVDEEGTEAAAATAMRFKLMSSIIKNIPIFKADHAFSFFLKDNNTIIFQGRFVSPN